MKKLKLLVLVLFVLGAVSIPGWSQNSVPQSAGLVASSTDCTTTGSCLLYQLSPTDSTVNVGLGGTFSGTASFEAQVGGIWAAIYGVPWVGGAQVGSSTATGGWTFDVMGRSAFRVRASSYTSGTIGVTITSSPIRSNNVTASTTRTQVDSYTSAQSATWTKPSGAISVTIVAIGAGGAGGAGIASTAAGGGGGGGGACMIHTFKASELPSTLSLVVGAAGVGGATKSVATASTVTASSKVIMSAGFGVIGIDASSNSGGGGGGGGGNGSLAVAANSSPGTQAAGGVGAGGGTGATTGGIGGKGDNGGGGGGGGLNATGAGAGGTSNCGGGGGGGGAATGTAGAGGVGGQGAAGGTSQGGSATSTGVYTLGGSGGGGGGQTTQTGGVGAAPGGGGGGGGNLANSGGNGADGSITIITNF